MVITEEQKMVVPLTRPMFIEGHPGEVKAKEQEHIRRSGMLKNELDRLRSILGIRIKTAIGMMRK